MFSLERRRMVAWIPAYRKPLYIDQSLHFQSHHPTHVKRGLMRSLYDCTRCITTLQDNLEAEEQHLATVLKLNGYPNRFVCVISTSPLQVTATSQDEGQDDDQSYGEDPKLVIIPYVAGLGGDIRRICRRFDIKVFFST